MLDFPNGIHPIFNPRWYCSHGTVVKRHFAHAHPQGLRKYFVFLLSSGDFRPWDPAAVEPSTCSSERQDLAEPNTFDAEAPYVSTLHIRAVRALKFCSISANLIAKSFCVFVICESMRDMQFVRVGICARFEVYKFRKERIELFIRCTSRAGAYTIEVRARAIRTAKNSKR